MMNIKLTRNEKLAAIGIGAILVVPKLAGYLANQSAQAAVNAATGAATGTVVAIGQTVGVPAVNASKCKQDILTGDAWNASFDCDMPTYLKYVWNRNSQGFDPVAFTQGMAGLGGTTPDWKTLALLGGAVYLMMKKYPVRGTRKGR